MLMYWVETSVFLIFYCYYILYTIHVHDAYTQSHMPHKTQCLHYTCICNHKHTLTPNTRTHAHTIVKKITELYADAAKHYPKNQEILTHLFMAYVRIGDYQKQQQTAAALHKNFPQSGPYYCWRVMSVLMQVCSCSYVCTLCFMLIGYLG